MLPATEDIECFIIIPFVFLGILTIYYCAPSLKRTALDRIPNAHWSSSWSSTWILWTRYHSKELSMLIEKHRQLGPIIRLGPADISISCYENGVRTIYNGGFEKPEYYDFFAYFGRTNAFCSKSRQDHTLRRKRISSVYAKSSLFASKQLFSLTRCILSDRLLPLLVQQSLSKESTNVLLLSYGLCLDLLTCFQFGLASGSDFLCDADSTKLECWLKHYQQRYCKAAFWPQELPKLTRWLRYIGLDMLPGTQHRSTQYLEEWLLRLCDRAEMVHLDLYKGAIRDPADVPVVYQQVKKAVQIDLHRDSPAIQRDEIASELFDHMCGREVFGLVLAYTIYYISMHPHTQAQLRLEFSNLVNTEEEVPSLAIPQPGDLDKLPYLSAVLKESFRLRPNSTPLPRITPKDRAISLAGIDGIPPGTRVNTFQWLIHRNPDNYDHVDEWYPERWMASESRGDKEPLLWAFGGGSRTCVGTSLTQYLMRYVLFVIYSNFSSKLVFKQAGSYEPGSPEDMILVRFQRLEGGDEAVVHSGLQGP